MGNYQGYQKYKDSGVEWLGEIPEHWDIWKVTHGFKNVGSGTTPKSDNSTFYDGDIPWITTSELRETLIEDTSQKVTQEALKNHSALKVYPKGSIAIAMYGATIGRLGILGIDATVNQACYVFSESEIFHLPFFYYWLWMHRPNLIALSAGGGQPNLSQDDLKQLRLPTPTLNEQEKIAQFLDYKTKQIDELIKKKETLIEKLDEKRTAIISHAVTKGLDSSVPIKDSGVEWLGDIPKHWEVKKLQYIGRLKSGENIISQQIDKEGLYPVFGGNGLRGYFDSYTHDGHYILIGRQGALCGNINYANGKFWASEHAVVITPSINFDVYWLGELLKAMNLNQYSTSAAQPGLSVEQISRVKTPFPPIYEQKQISKHLDQKTTQIDQQKAKIKQAIELLKEYRTSLITNAVTGKIDVSQIAIPSPQKPQPQKG
jgi:restriction endonuclease S subunit